MKLYLLTQDTNDGYDTLSACVVCAANEEDARRIPPSEIPTRALSWDLSSWADLPDKVTVQEIGIAHDDVVAALSARLAARVNA